MPVYSSLKEVKREITNYMAGYYSQVRPYQYNGGPTLNESGRRYWLEYKTVGKIS